MSAPSAIPFYDIPDDELSEEQLRQKYAPVCIGPTWRKKPDGSWDLPEYTLGWEIAGWCAEFLHGPDGQGRWQFTPEQLRFVLWWYALNERGEFIYSSGVMQRLKGHGKDPLAAVLCLVELVGPSRFDHWELDKKTGAKRPVGKRNPAAWVQIAAVNQSQTRNTATLFPSIMSDHFKATYDVRSGAEITYAMGSRVRLEAVTSSFRALEGGRSSFILLNETHHWVAGNNGTQMYDTIVNNATKMDGRYLAITNAYLPGEDSVAERWREAYDKTVEGKLVDVGMMYDSLEAPAHAPMDPKVLPVILDMVRGDSKWLKIESIMKSILNATIAVSRSRRMWLNQIVAEEDALYSQAQWDPLEQPESELAAGDEIVLGFDGGKSDDATALVAIRVRDTCVFPLGIWEKPDGPQGDGWEIDREMVDSVVHETFRLYDVKGFYADVALWESYISEWEKAYGDGLAVKSAGFSAIGWDMRQSLKKITFAHERLMRTIFDQKLSHNGNKTLRRHVLNARRRSNNYGISFGKESRESPRKVDAYAAMLLAFECLHDLNARGKTVKKKTGRGYFL
ncbi:phage terminase family protein [Cellulomonas sp. SG140]|uniref:phage terminase family protein n=1 Tax=Cellulomonas sp. SG140 TaxID=2976536 RepID=UPI0021E9331A|nr:phage terminase family protein [Cellulomonas sp. SG140]